MHRVEGKEEDDSAAAHRQVAACKYSALRQERADRMNTCNLAPSAHLCQRLHAIACNTVARRNLDLWFARFLNQPRGYDDASPLPTAHYGARYVPGLFSSRLPGGDSRCWAPQHRRGTNSDCGGNEFPARKTQRRHYRTYSFRALPSWQKRSSTSMWAQQRSLSTSRGRMTGPWPGNLHENLPRPSQSPPGPTLTQKAHGHERRSSKCCEKYSLLPWMTARRPFYLSDCEKALKCLGKLPETTSWDQFLDIGCGAGDLTRGIVKEFGGLHRVVVATERSAEVVQRDIAYEVLDVESDVTEALRSWGRFRRVFSFFHLESVKDKPRALANIRRLLWEDGGELFLLFRVQSNLQPLYQMLAEDGRWKKVAAVSTYMPGAEPFENGLFACLKCA
ncbi:hypothetical protein HPB48_011227 [Haemaphysalis longicornis]|uniref:Methyltransferase domain-containing protein n=1 Tax=Haemaphysalis longicornis TaxID=44386 RepID=A0A9J6FYT9_HAELO|nr:hypothetical protein HPB48_011227 [Haemaphysalis longicornis]